MTINQSTGGTADLVNETDPGTRDGTAALATQRSGDGGDAPLLPEDSAAGYRDQWHECQASFVDEPRTAVQQADQLVADLVRDLATQFADERSRLEEQWSRGEEVSTEDLRLALQRYRSFFNRLLRV